MSATNETPAPNTEPGKVAAPPRKPIDFAKVDGLRKLMLLTTSQAATFFGVSRVTYYSWLRGTYPRGPLEEQVRQKIRVLLWCITEKNWPTQDVLLAMQKQRFEMLMDLVKELDQPAQTPEAST